MSFMAVLALLTLGTLLPSPTASQTGNAVSLLPRVLPITGQTCSGEVQEMLQSQISQDARAVLRDNFIFCPGAQPQASPAASCSTIPTSCPSGNYWVRSSNGSAVQVYCDMDRVCGCSGTGGWVRIAYLNTTDTSQQCPSAWRLITTPRRTCGRSTEAASCDSAVFSSNGIRYTEVCGRVVAYQFVTPDGTFNGNADGSAYLSIETYYVDGVSITHGAPGSRQHIWSFSGAPQPNLCPCSYNLSAVPSFVGQDYFCETGNDNFMPLGGVFADDPLWDGQNCSGTNAACECSYNSPPWFCKQLPRVTSDDIEVRICFNEALANEDTPLELLEVYVR